MLGNLAGRILFRSLLAVAAACLGLVLSSRGEAAELSVWETSIDGKAVIEVTGAIQVGDDEKFRAISVNHPSAFVVLKSDGGQLRPAIAIGRLVRLAGYETVVLAKADCASVCALIWAAGSTRWLAQDGRVGFHASYRNENGQLVESGVANALVGHYLTILGYPAKSVIFASKASPSEILWLNKMNSADSGFNFEVLDPAWGNRPSGEAKVNRSGKANPYGIESLKDPDYFYDWTWGAAGPSKIMEFEDYETGKLFHIRVPSFAEYDDVTPLINAYGDDRWIWYSSSETGTEAHFDLDSIISNSSIVLLWARFDHSRDKTEKYRTTKVKIKIDCNNKRLIELESIYYMPDGSFKSSTAPSYALPSSIIPDTMGEDLWRMVCWRTAKVEQRFR